MRTIKLNTCRGRRASLRSGDNFFSQKEIDKIAEKYSYETKEYADYIRKRGYDVEKIARILKDYLRAKTNYLPNNATEYLLNPACLIKHKYGGRKSMTIFASAVLRQLKIPHAIRIVKKNKNYFNHVYVAEIGGYSGLVVDPTDPCLYDEPTYREKKDLWVKKF